MKVKKESEKVGLQLNIQKTKIMAFGPITSWEIDGEIVETVSHFILGGYLEYSCHLLIYENVVIVQSLSCVHVL